MGRILSDEEFTEILERVGNLEGRPAGWKHVRVLVSFLIEFINDPNKYNSQKCREWISRVESVGEINGDLKKFIDAVTLSVVRPYKEGPGDAAKALGAFVKALKTIRPDRLRDEWAALGVAFSSAEPVKFDPESALINLVRSGEFPEDKKMICLALAWLKDYSSVVNLDQIREMAESLSPEEMAILGGIALKCVRFGDARWQLIAEKALGQGDRVIISDSPYSISEGSIDDDFRKVGVRVIKIKPSDGRKLVSHKRILNLITNAGRAFKPNRNKG